MSPRMLAKNALLWYTLYGYIVWEVDGSFESRGFMAYSISTTRNMWGEGILV